MQRTSVVSALWGWVLNPGSGAGQAVCKHRLSHSPATGTIPMENILETLVPLPLAIRQLSPRNWNFPRNLYAGSRKRLKAGVSKRTDSSDKLSDHLAGGTGFYTPMAVMGKITRTVQLCAPLSVHLNLSHMSGP